MLRYGSDKPDLRYGLEIADVTEVLAAHRVRRVPRRGRGGGVVRGLGVSRGARVSRKDIDGLQEFAKEWGGKGLAWLQLSRRARSARRSPSSCARPRSTAIARRRRGATAGSVVPRGRREGGRRPRARRAAPAPGERFELIDRTAGGSSTSSTSRSSSGDEETALGGRAPHVHVAQPRRTRTWSRERPGRAVLSEAYDMVLNGHEMASGSIRIHRPDAAAAGVRVVGLRAGRRPRSSFGFLLRALCDTARRRTVASRRARPHRRCCWPATENLREVIAFPKGRAASTRSTGAPSAGADAGRSPSSGSSINPPEHPPAGAAQ